MYTVLLKLALAVFRGDMALHFGETDPHGDGGDDAEPSADALVGVEAAT